MPSEALGLSEKVVASIAQGVDIREVGQMGVDFGAYVKDLKPVTLTSQALTDAALKVASLEYYKKQSGWLEKVHKDQGKPYAAAAIMEKKAAESVEKILTTELGIGAEVMGKLPSKGKQFAPIYEANFVSHQQGQSVLSFTHYATSEARLLLSGHELLIGWKFGQQLRAEVDLAEQLDCGEGLGARQSHRLRQAPCHPGPARSGACWLHAGLDHSGRCSIFALVPLGASWQCRCPEARVRPDFCKPGQPGRGLP